MLFMLFERDFLAKDKFLTFLSSKEPSCEFFFHYFNMILGYLANFPHGKVNSQTTLSAYCGIAARVAPMFLAIPLYSGIAIVLQRHLFSFGFYRASSSESENALLLQFF